jgi:transposase-like protein
MQPFSPIEALFKGRHFDGKIIILCVSWCSSFKLSLKDLVIMMADRGIPLAHTTILRWVQYYLPEFEKRWSRYARPVGGSWRMDETYIEVRGRWVYLLNPCNSVFLPVTRNDAHWSKYSCGAAVVPE